MKRHRSYGILFVLALASTSAAAAAQEKPKDARPPAASPGRSSPSDSYGYTFTDDALLVGTTGVVGFPVTIRVPPVRVMLLRPRTSFVVELLKSVENL